MTGISIWVLFLFITALTGEAENSDVGDKIEEVLTLTREALEVGGDLAALFGVPVLGPLLNATGKIVEVIGQQQAGKPEDKLFQKLEELDARLQKLATTDDTKQYYQLKFGHPMLTLQRQIHTIINPRPLPPEVRKNNWQTFVSICESKALDFSPPRLIENLLNFAHQCPKLTASEVLSFSQTLQFFQEQLHRADNGSIPDNFVSKVVELHNGRLLNPVENQEFVKHFSDRTFANAGQMFSVASKVLDEMNVPASTVCLLKSALERREFKLNKLLEFARAVREQLLFLAIADTLCLGATSGNSTVLLEHGISEVLRNINYLGSFVADYLTDALPKAWPSVHESIFLKFLGKFATQDISGEIKQQMLTEGINELDAVGDGRWRHYMLISPNAGDGDNYNYYYDCFSPQHCTLIKDQRGLHIAIGRYRSDNGSVATTLKNAELAEKLAAEVIEPRLYDVVEENKLEAFPKSARVVEDKLFSGQASGAKKFLREDGYHMMVVLRQYSDWWWKGTWACYDAEKLIHSQCSFPFDNRTQSCRKFDVKIPKTRSRQCQYSQWFFGV